MNNNNNNKVPKVYKSGYLTKQGRVVRSWKRRWCVLTGDNIIYYYKSRVDQEPAGAITLVGSKVTPSKRNDRKYGFEIATSDRIYYIIADNLNEMDDWINKINLARLEYQQSLVNVKIDTVPKSTLHVKGMMCDCCGNHVKKAINKVGGVDEIEINIEEEVVIITGKADLNSIQDRLEEAGFPTVRA
eukprot:TRINITY_DN217_c0_g1_i1.p1 TRINITY_DN217_c0_g1~~TRINITY_DN217_c0_g1_i1.p1  ORF type:complete len:187 (+),score=51.62 TRINITY_DN217_c0_g1_i1:250-810(+)